MPFIRMGLMIKIMTGIKVIVFPTSETCNLSLLSTGVAWNTMHTKYHLRVLKSLLLGIWI